MNQNQVTCKDVMHHLCDHLGEDLNSPKCVEIKEHLDNCDNCSKYYDSIVKTVGMYKSYNVEINNEKHNDLLKFLGLNDNG